MDPGCGSIEPRFLVATNHFHWMGIPEWRARFPDAKIVSTSVAAPRLRSKLSMEIGSIADIPLPEKGSRWIEPPGVGSGEVWLDVFGTWFVCDAFFNEPKVADGMMGVGLRLSGTVPGLRIGQTWKYMQLDKRAEYKSWLLETLERSPPKRLVPAHGDPIEGADLGSRLADLVRARL